MKPPKRMFVLCAHFKSWRIFWMKNLDIMDCDVEELGRSAHPTKQEAQRIYHAKSNRIELLPFERWNYSEKIL